MWSPAHVLSEPGRNSRSPWSRCWTRANISPCHDMHNEYRLSIIKPGRSATLVVTLVVFFTDKDPVVLNQEKFTGMVTT
ncbi:hypothetical protein RRG08_022880 [Elysia crispata]|uniref:Uncharacterized protein n=1 Tax=Elysia crispata TaxID=231223 RepID=A0AAE0Z0C7_9GAST|nr:hypothetical protein RRG08_022880 [Elysia crispata]